MSWNKSYNHSQKEMNNHANQCNPNNREYYNSRGYVDNNDSYSDISSYSSENDVGIGTAIVGGLILGAAVLITAFSDD